MDFENTNQIKYSDPLQSVEAALHGLSERTKAISANIANVNTEGYSRRQVSFEDRLQQQIDRSEQIELDTTTTDEQHLTEEVIDLRDAVSTDLDTDSPSNGINNVNIEREMIDLTQTGLRFKAVSTMAKKYFENMRGIIRG